MSTAMPTMIERIRGELVGLKMPRTLEALDQFVRRLEQAEISALEAIDILLAEEPTLRENSRVKTALRMPPSRRSTASTSPYSPRSTASASCALAQLEFVAHHEVVHFLVPPGTGKSHLAIALGVEAVKAGRSVYLCTQADLLDQLARAAAICSFSSPTPARSAVR